jgi:hypothetical protein
MDTESARPPLACVMDAIPHEERPEHVALISRLFGGAAREREDLPEGYAFRFGAEDLASVIRFVANERKCCPFLTFELTMMPEQGPVWLRLSGPPGTRAFLAAELPIQDGGTGTGKSVPMR